MVNNLYPALSAEGVDDIVDLRFYAWGNAYVDIESCSTGEYSKTAMYCWIDTCGDKNSEKRNETAYDERIMVEGNIYDETTDDGNCWNETLKICQHGEPECLANIYEACAGAHADSQKAFVQFLYCFEKNEGGASSVRSCAEKASIDADTLESCAKGPEGLKLDTKNAMATASFGSSRLGTPWIVVNGKHLEDPSEMLQAICDAYENASKPLGCESA